MFAPVIIFTIPLLIKQLSCRSVMARHNHIAVHSQIPVTNGFLISTINLSYASTAQSISVDKNVTLTHGGDNHMK